jgi:hypothetical protein
VQVGARVFIERVAGPGVHYIAWPGAFRVVGSETRPVIYHRAFTDPVEGAAAAAGLAGRHDVYFTPAAYKVAKTVDAQGREKSFRKQENVASLKALYVDLDFKKYPGPAAAVAALRTFLETSGVVRPNVVVETGGGLHIYWVLDAPVRPVDWLPVSRALVAAMQAASLEADYGVTIDTARILRVPGTVNRKYSHHPECRVVKWDAADISLDVLADSLQAYSGVTNSLALRATPGVLAALPQASNSDLSDGYVRGRFYDPTRIAEACPVVADSLARGGDGDDYPLWMQLLHLMAYTNDGEGVARQLSTGDSRFTEDGFQRVWSDRLALAGGGQVGPTTCERFSMLSGKCQGCPHAGKIKTPLVLGFSAPEHRAAQIETGQRPQPTYVRHGHTFMMRKTDEGESQEVMVAACEIANWEVGHDKELGRYVKFKVTAGRNTADLTVPVSAAADERELQKVLLAHGVPTAKGGARLFGAAMVDWMDHLQKQRRIEPLPGFGWDQDGGFAVAGTRYMPDGGILGGGSAAGSLSYAYGASGTLEDWKRVSAVFTADKRPAVHTMIAAAFAAPLLRFVEQPSFMLSVCGPLSGVGKTTLLRYAAAVWGDPGSGIMSLDDTGNSITQRMALTRYLPTLWDELRSEADFDRFVNVAFRALQGQSKQRLNSRAELRSMPPINTVMVATSNSSIVDAVALRTRGSPAGLYRLLETEMPPIADTARAAAVTAAVVELKEVYGVAGRRYAAFLATAGAARIRKVLAIAQDKIQADFAPDPMERFWAQGAATLLAGGMLARSSGMADVDVPSVYACLKGAMAKARSRVVTHVADEKNVAAEIVNRFSGNVVILSHATGDDRAEVVLDPPTRVARVFVGVRDKKLVMPMAVAEEFAHAKGLSLSQIKTAMMVAVGANPTLCNPGAGSQYALGRTRALVMDVDRALGPAYLRRYT